jgi:hypothetical protein
VEWAKLWELRQRRGSQERVQKEGTETSYVGMTVQVESGRGKLSSPRDVQRS